MTSIFFRIKAVSVDANDHDQMYLFYVIHNNKYLIFSDYI